MTHAYRTHNCSELRKSDEGSTVKLSGWVHRIYDLGGVLFIILRDTYGITQCVVEEGSPLMSDLEKIRVESVLTIEGKVAARDDNTINAKMPTGEVEIRI
ncbi:MAG: aspartate--tRNA ligase, partial [Alphaproteobacteria bacterium]|nr:aspartate--tRNA ligase [Alphaproteobacteria bacterium]